MSLTKQTGLHVKGFVFTVHVWESALGDKRNLRDKTVKGRNAVSRRSPI